MKPNLPGSLLAHRVFHVAVLMPTTEEPPHLRPPRPQQAPEQDAQYAMEAMADHKDMAAGRRIPQQVARWLRKVGTQRGLQERATSAPSLPSVREPAGIAFSEEGGEKAAERDRPRRSLYSKGVGLSGFSNPAEVYAETGTTAPEEGRAGTTGREEQRPQRGLGRARYR